MFPFIAFARTVIGIVYIVILSIAQGYDANQPGEKLSVPLKFEAFKSKHFFTGQAAPVNLSTHPQANRYRTILKRTIKRGVNCAGELIIISHGCGSTCQMNWIIEAKTGTIIDRIYSHWGIEYKKDADLIIIDPPPATEQEKMGCSLPTYYLIWKKGKLKTLGYFDFFEAKDEE